MSDLRVGTGFDAHRLVPGRRLMLGGVEIPFDRGLEGHSDGDCLLHAVCDALLGVDRSPGVATALRASSRLVDVAVADNGDGQLSTSS